MSKVTSDVREIPLESLLLPPYQRTNEERAARLRAMRKEGWREEKAQVIDVTDAGNNLFNVMDGYTRAMFALEVGKISITARVVDGLTHKDEVKNFINLQTDRTRVNSEQRYRAARYRRDPFVIGIDKAIEAAGGRVDVKPASRGPFGFVCHSTLVYLAAKENGHDILERSARALIEAFPTGGGHTWKALAKWPLGGVFYFIMENPDYNHQKLVSGLASLDTPTRIQQDAEDMWRTDNKKLYDAGIEPTKRPTYGHYARTIAKLYKRGRVRK